MKTIIGYLFIISVCIFQSCGNKNTDETQAVSPDIVNNPASASGEEQKSDRPEFQFEETSFDFGTLKEGEEVHHEFKFKNSGDQDLVISQASGSCGCTVPEYPKAPVKPGDKGVIKVTFRSQGIAGQVAKTITLVANTTPSTKVLTISGEVIKNN